VGYKRLPLLQSGPPISYQHPGFRFAPPWAEASYAFGVFSDPPPNKTQLYWKVGIARHPECREREPANGGCEGTALQASSNDRCRERMAIANSLRLRAILPLYFSFPSCTHRRIPRVPDTIPPVAPFSARLCGGISRALCVPRPGLRPWSTSYQ